MARLEGDKRGGSGVIWWVAMPNDQMTWKAVPQHISTKQNSCVGRCQVDLGCHMEWQARCLRADYAFCSPFCVWPLRRNRFQNVTYYWPL